VGVLASAVAMDKEFTKKLLAAEALPVGDLVILRPGTVTLTETTLTETQRERLGLPVFVKPARAGSSVGITKVREWATLPAAIEVARAHDPKVLVEAALTGREIECGVLEFPRSPRPAHGDTAANHPTPGVARPTCTNAASILTCSCANCRCCARSTSTLSPPDSRVGSIWARAALKAGPGGISANPTTSWLAPTFTSRTYIRTNGMSAARRPSVQTTSPNGVTQQKLAEAETSLRTEPHISKASWPRYDRTAKPYRWTYVGKTSTQPGPKN
jgi:hypothetical protein